MKKIAVIGGGFTGLTMTWALWRQLRQNMTEDQFQIDLYERSPNLGGLLQTQTFECGLVEPAANAILGSQDLKQMADDFGVKWAVKKKTAKKRWVMTHKGPSRWPLSLMTTFRNASRLFALAKGQEALRPKDFETVTQWSERVFRTPEVLQQLIAPALQGVYADHPDQLSARLCLDSLFTKSTERNLGSVAPEKGMVEWFEKGLIYFQSKKNIHTHLNFDVTQDLLDAKSTKELDGEIAKDLAAENFTNSLADCDVIIDCRPNAMGLKINFNSVASVSMFWDKNHRPAFEGFGCLFPKAERYLGVLFDSDIFEGRAFDENLFLEKWIVRTEGLGWDTSDTEALLNFRRSQFLKSYDDVSDDFSSDDLPKPVFTKANFWEKAIPKYDLQLERQLEFAHKKYHQGARIFMKQGTENHIFHGNYLGDLGLNKILKKSKVIAHYVKGIL